MKARSDDRVALIDRVAAAMWESRGTEGDEPWPDAPAIWRERFRELAGAAVEEMKGA